ncbi:PLP-dependent aminotransferase family protein [Pseudonocardia halophobica]|uniref:MocR-like pyridoxine biosynthesis transcription factor PdxR n=1 Tax=Pseudonocardia halophobica TaxID=29401 RepID=UPI0009DFC927|nr:PLP-dependent aminotransferase family protein [Pseudonocardia halophobica]
MTELPPLHLDRAGPEPLAAQLADALRAAAAGGALRAGDRLPSTRELAAVLRVSRTVTAAAYDQLLAEGWVEGRVGAGTFVTAVPAAGPAPGPEPRREPADEGARIELRPGTPCTEVLDRAAWRRAWRAAADPEPDLLPRYAGLPGFRAAVGEHLLRHRGLVARPDEVLATGGSTGAIAELARVLPEGARVAVEEPGYRRAADALAAAGLEVVGVPVDDEGLRVEDLPTGLAAVYCTPAHQFPVGGRMPAARRIALVERARVEGLLVIEDDYDGELRYDVAPLPLLAALGPDVVAHVGTASKILTPTLGVGWLVAPPVVRAAVAERRERTGSRPAPAGQRVFAAFATSGDLARHLRRLRRELGERRRLLVEALAGVPLRGDRAGAHVLVPLPDAATARAVQAAAAERGVGLEVLERYAGAEAGGGIVIGYAGSTRAEFAAALPVLAEVLEGRVAEG